MNILRKQCRSRNCPGRKHLLKSAEQKVKLYSVLSDLTEACITNKRKPTQS